MFNRIRNIKIILVAVAILIAIATLFTSNYLIRDLQQEERQRMEVWAEAMRSLNSADENTDLNLVLQVINGNNTIPVIVVDKEGNVQTHRNLDIKFEADEDSMSILKQKSADMIEAGQSIRIYPNEVTVNDTLPSSESEETEYIVICYDESLMIKRLALYPYILLAVVVIFVAIAIFALFSSMRAEQNKVWVGLSKETAHQLGTPISSLMAWVEVLKETHPDDQLLPEMEKDVQRLQLIADRFSKIGSIPEPHPEDLCAVLQRVIDYMDHRTSNKVHITCDLPSKPVYVSLIAPLFEWVAENLCKNAVDAMSGSGSIRITLYETDDQVFLEFRDTGKGIAKSNFKNVFKPGFTTKKRGWGLGLSLAKRIIEDYHHGSIFVNSSEIGKGTTFRIELPK